MVERNLPIAARAIDLGKLVVCRRIPCVSPRCLIEPIVSLLLATEFTEHESQIVERFDILGTGIVHFKAIGSGTEVSFGIYPVVIAYRQNTELVIDIGVTRITAQCLRIVRHGIHRTVELIDTQACQIKFFNRSDVGRPGKCSQSLRLFLSRIFMLGRNITHEQSSVSIEKCNIEIILSDTIG